MNSPDVRSSKSSIGQQAVENTGVMGNKHKLLSKALTEDEARSDPCLLNLIIVKKAKAFIVAWNTRR